VREKCLHFSRPERKSSLLRTPDGPPKTLNKHPCWWAKLVTPGAFSMSDFVRICGAHSNIVYIAICVSSIMPRQA